MIPIDLPAIEQSLAEYAAVTCEAEDVEVTWLGVDPSLGEGRHHWEGDPCRPTPTLRLVTESSRLTVHPKLVITVQILVVSDAVSPGEPITWTHGTARLEQIIGDPVPEGDWIARIRLDPGDPLTHSVVAVPLDARAGAEVKILVSRGAIRVSAPGRLLTNGRIGQTVRVTNKATGAPMSGTLVDANTVEIP